MIKHIWPALGALIWLSACQDNRQYAPPIEELATRWEQTTAALVELAEETQRQQVLADSLLSAMPLETTDSLRRQLAGQAAALDTLRNQVASFLERWENPTDQLRTLREDLERGQIPDEIEAKISALEQINSSARANHLQWEADMQDILKRNNTSHQRELN